MTLPLLKVADHGVQFNFDEIAKRIVDTGGRQVKLRFGSSSATFSASSFSGLVTVTHGMGSAPVAVVAVPNHSSGITPLTAVVEGTPGATSFTVRLYVNPSTTAVSGTWNFFWVAFG